MTLTGPVFFLKLLLNSALHDTKIGCILLVWSGAKKYTFSFLLCAGSLRSIKQERERLQKISVSDLHFLPIRIRAKIFMRIRIRIRGVKGQNGFFPAFFVAKKKFFGYKLPETETLQKILSLTHSSH